MEFFAQRSFLYRHRNVVCAQRALRRKFNLTPKVPVPSCQAIKLWDRHFAATTSTTKKQGCIVKTSRTPEDIELTREALVKRHSIQRGNTDRT